MPELPEVETVIRVLKEWVLNKTIKNVVVKYEPILENKSKEDFCSELANKKITDIKRKGKYILFYLDKTVLISHLRMEGKYYLAHYPDSNNKIGEEYIKTNYPIYHHTHVVFEMDDDSLLLYHDVRKFGKFYLTDIDHLDESILSKLGLEPFDVKDPNYLYEKVINSSSTIKELLLDQSILLGIGNIYADEICFASKVYPFRKANTLSLNDCNELINNAVKILNHAIELGGSSVHSFSSGNHVDGKFQNELKVYGRENEPCKECGSSIIKITLGGRGTCFCPVCQSNKLELHNVIGVTGLISSGKSTIANYFTKLGYVIADADKLAHECYEVGSSIYKKIIELFGEDILVNKQIDRGIIRSKLNKDNLKSLENIIHPEVIKKIKQIIKDNKKVILDVPLLFESKLNKLCDKTIFVHCNGDIRKKRIIEKNAMSIKDAKLLNNNEQEITKKMKMCDYVINNSSTIENSYAQIEKLIHK